MCGGRSPEHARRSFVGVDGPGPQAIGVSPLDGSGPQAVGVSPLVRPHLRPEGPTVNSRRCEPPERAPRREASPQRGRQSVCLRRALPPLTGARVSGDAGFRRLTPPATDYRPFRAWYCTATRPFHRGTGILPCVAGPSWPCKAWFAHGQDARGTHGQDAHATVRPPKPLTLPADRAPLFFPERMLYCRPTLERCRSGRTGTLGKRVYS